MRHRFTLLAMSALLASTASIGAARAEVDLRAINARLDALERENAQLRARMNQMNPGGSETRTARKRAAPAASTNPADANAKYFPTKVEPVRYVRLCDNYGPGYFYFPGTHACIKIGGYLRAQAGYHVGGSGVVYGSGVGASAPAGSVDQLALQGRFERGSTNDANFMGRAAVSLDVRVPTRFGDLRGYARGGVEHTPPAGGAFAPAVFWDRGYIEFAGATIGKSRSMFDIFNISRPLSDTLSYGNLKTSGSTDLSGVLLAAYTFKAGNGFSATISAEDPGGHFKAGAADATQAVWAVNGGVTVDNAYSLQSGTANGFRAPDVVANLRIDQSWGYAGVSAVAHNVAGAYYGTANSTNSFHPEDKWGWAGSGGFEVKVPGTSGDTFGVNGVYSVGAVGYALSGHTWQIYKNNDSVGVGWAVDGIFDGPAGTGPGTRTPIELTTAWSINAGYQHIWNPEWKTSLYGGYAQVKYNSAATTIINSHLPGAAGTRPCGPAVAGAVWPPLNIPVGSDNSCNPNFSFYQVGTRTQWNPTPWLDLGVDVQWTHLNTAYKGTATGIYPANAPRPAMSTISDQNVFSALARAQLNFYP